MVLTVATWLTCTFQVPSVQQSLDRILIRLQSESGTPAIVASIGKNDKVIATSVAGHRDMASKVPARASDLVMIGSVSKPLSASMIARCVDQGIIKWDTKLSDVFPGLSSTVSGANSSATVLQLLSHRSGLTRAMAPTIGLSSKSGPEYRQNLLTATFALAPKAMPGALYEYNAGPTLVAAMLETLTGQAYEQLMEDQVFKPIGLTSFGMGKPWEKFPDKSLVGQLKDKEGMWGPAPGNWQPHLKFDPSGGWYCQIGQLCKFGLAQCFGSKLSNVSEAGKKMMFTSPYGDGKAPGWANSGDKHGRWAMHTGDTSLGDSTVLLIEPQKGYSIAFFFNMSHKPASQNLMNSLREELENLVTSNDN